MKTKIRLMFFIGFLLGVTNSAMALTTDELVRLKKAGLSDDTIVFMSENDYNEAEKVLLLKEVGYKDESILAIIKSEVKKKALAATTSATSAFVAPSPIPTTPKAEFETPAKVKIIRYLMYHDKPLLKNKESIDAAQVSITGKTIQINWEKKGGMDPGNAFQKEPFEPPFYLELNSGDVVEQGKEGYAWMLQTVSDNKNQQEKLSMDGYWVIYFDPKDQKLVDYIKNVLSKK